MDILRAKELLAVLADGVNPLTGEVLSQDDSCNQAEIVRAIYCVLAEVETKPAKSATTQPSNAGKPWTDHEESMLTSEFDAGMKTVEISKLHQRSRGAITSHLKKMGLSE